MSSVLVVGGGRVGSHLASLLLEGGHEVTVVEVDQSRSGGLESRARFVTGSGTEAEVLEDAGVRNCDVLAAVTGIDEANLVSAALARFEFGVPRVIARIVDPSKAWMYTEEMGIDVALNQADLLAHLVAEEMSLGEMTILLKLRKGQYALVEEKVDPESSVIDLGYRDIQWPDRCRIIAILRTGQLIDLSRSRIRPGDEVLALAPSETTSDLAALLGPA
ncbi:MAG: TrkA family potassium uptake protein [Acidimicrobiia bacterium]